jgi:hypothetical protein
VIRKPLVADGLNDSFKLLRAPKSIRLHRDMLPFVRDARVRRPANNPIIQCQLEDVLSWRENSL